MVENELLLFGNHEGVKVESVGNLALIGNIKVLASLTIIIVSVSVLQSLDMSLCSENAHNLLKSKILNQEQ